MDLVAGATRSFFVTGNDNFLLQKRFVKDYIAVGEDDIGLVGYWSKTKNRARKGIKSSKTSQEREENWSKIRNKARKAPRNAKLLEQEKLKGKKSSKSSL